MQRALARDLLQALRRRRTDDFEEPRLDLRRIRGLQVFQYRFDGMTGRTVWKKGD
jgi:hypothetical protein